VCEGTAFRVWAWFLLVINKSADELQNNRKGVVIPRYKDWQMLTYGAHLNKVMYFQALRKE
jgi:hypothetical protein